MEETRSRPWGWIALALVVVTLVNAAISNQRPVDDAFIFFRYIDNFLRGYGLTWNKGGERVEGYTSFLYLAVLTVPRALGAAPLRAANVVNGALFALAAVSSASLLRTLLGRFTRAALLAPLLIASSAVLGMTARNGMESMLFAVLVVISLDVLLRASSTGSPRMALASGMLFGLATLTRPEGALLYGVAVAYSVYLRRREGEPLAIRLEVYRLAGLLLVLAPHVAFRHAYYGEWLPNTYYAKVGGNSLRQIKTGAWGLVDCLKGRGGLVIGLAPALWLAAPRSRRVDLLALLFAVWTAWVVRMGLENWWYWYSVPVHLFALLLAGASLAEIIDRPEERAPARRAVAAVIVVLATPGTFALPAGQDGIGLGLYALRALASALVIAQAARAIVERAPAALGYAAPAVVAVLVLFHAGYALVLRRAEVATFTPAAYKLKEIAAPGATLATGACGEIPYVSDLVTIDVLGLNDRHIAHSPMPERRYGGFGHDKGDGPYVLAQKPTYLIPHPFATPKPEPGPGWAKSFVEIFAMPELREDYTFRSLRLDDGRYFNFYERKPGR